MPKIPPYQSIYHPVLYTKHASLKAELVKVVSSGGSSDHARWIECLYAKRPSLVENLELYGYIKNTILQELDPSLQYRSVGVKLALTALLDFYEGMSKKAFLVLGEAVKCHFEKSAWYNTDLHKQEGKANIFARMQYIRDCLHASATNDSKFHDLLQAIEVFIKFEFKDLRDAIGHNVLVVQGTVEADSRIFYSTEQRPYFQKACYKSLMSTDVFKAMDALSYFNDLVTEAFHTGFSSDPNMVPLECKSCGFVGIGLKSGFAKKECYFCKGVGNFENTSKTGTQWSTHPLPLP